VKRKKRKQNHIYSPILIMAEPV